MAKYLQSARKFSFLTVANAIAEASLVNALFASKNQSNITVLFKLNTALPAELDLVVINLNIFSFILLKSDLGRAQIPVFTKRGGLNYVFNMIKLVWDALKEKEDVVLKFEDACDSAFALILKLCKSGRHFNH